jgi:T5orf172 domain
VVNLTQELDLDKLLKDVGAQEFRHGQDGTGAALGIDMVRAAREFVRLPSPKTLAAFERIEDQWRALHPKARRRFSNAFRQLLDGSTPSRPKYEANTPYNKSWNPHRGFVYGFWSHDYYGLVKLGATTQHPTDRMVHFNRKYNLQHVAIAFFFEVTHPALVERDWTSYLETYRKSVGNQGSREWYELTPAAAIEHVQASISRTGVTKLKTNYILKKLTQLTEIDFWPTGPKRFGAHIVPSGRPDC